jgi:hypothetical protein
MSYRIYSIILAFLILTVSVHASVISYWRFEVDNNPARNKLDSPNEIVGEPSVISKSGKLDSTANPGSLPNTIVPITGAPNTSSLDGSPLDVNATVAYSSTLDVSSMTVELWARTEESDAVIISRTNSTDPSRGNINDGFRIYDPQDLKVEYVLTDGNTTTNITIDTNFSFDSGVIGDGIADWHHIAFAYDETTGVGNVYADGVSIGSHISTVGDTLHWGDIAGGDQPIVHIGTRMDGYNFSKTRRNNGFIDEIRFSDIALEEDDLLITPVPEPSIWVTGVGLCFFILYQRFSKK